MNTCRRQETEINRQFGFLDHHPLQENFLTYFEKITRRKYQKWSIVYQHFLVFTGGKCTFGEVTVDLCMKFREYLLHAHQLKCTNKKLSQNAAAGYFSTFRALLKMAYKENLLRENINDYLDYIEWEEVEREFLTQEELIQLAQTTFRALLKMAYKENLLRENINDYLDYIEWEEVEREFLTQEELIQLAQTPCEIEVLKRASLFSCLTGLRFSDVYNLTWEHVREVSGIGLCLVFRTQKTKTPTTLPLCQEAIELMGETTTGKVFEGFKKTEVSGIGLCLVFRTQKTKTPTTLPLCQEAIELMGETTTGKVFEGFKKTMTSQPLRNWIEAAGIRKHITFHCFRHTYATLQMAMSINPYVVSQALTHKNLETTLRYTHDIPTALMDTLGKISIKPKDLSAQKSPAD